MWLDEDFDVKVRLYRDAANRRKARMAKLWLLNAAGSDAKLLDVDDQFLRASIVTAHGNLRAGKATMSLAQCTVVADGMNQPEGNRNSATPEKDTSRGPQTESNVNVKSLASRPLSSRHNKVKPPPTHWTPPPPNSRPSTNGNPPGTPRRVTDLHVGGKGAIESTVMLPTASSLIKSSPRPPQEPRKQLPPDDREKPAAQWRTKLPPALDGGEAPMPEQRPWFVQSVKDVFRVINPSYLDVSSSDESLNSGDEGQKSGSGDDGCSSDDYDGLNTLMNFLKLTNSQPKGKRREEDEQKQQEDRLNIIRDLVTNGVRKFAEKKKAAMYACGGGCDGDDSAAHQQQGQPRFPIELVRGISATPKVEMESAVIDVEFPTSFLLRELNNQYEMYDARATAERQQWLKAHGFSASFVPYEHPDERARRLARRDAQVLAEVSSASLDHLKHMWEGFGTGHQSSQSMLQFHGEAMASCGTASSRDRHPQGVRFVSNVPVAPPRRALAEDFGQRRRLVPSAPPGRRKA